MGSKAELRAMRTAKKKTQKIITIVVIIIGAILVAGVLMWPSLSRRDVVSNPRPMANFTSMGDPNAPVKVEEFSDYQCPYCKSFAEEKEPTLVKDYVETGKVHFTYIPFSFLGPESVKAAEAAYCAADQNKFWEYQDLIFEAQAGENRGGFSRSVFVSLANDLRLDMPSFQNCIDTGKFSKQVTDNLQYGREKGVTGTPFFLVNDRLVDSGQLTAAIEEALNTK